MAVNTAPATMPKTNMSHANRIRFASWSSRRWMRRSGLTRRGRILLVVGVGMADSFFVFLGQAGQVVGVRGAVFEALADFACGICCGVQGFVLAFNVTQQLGQLVRWDSFHRHTMTNSFRRWRPR